MLVLLLERFPNLRRSALFFKGVLTGAVIRADADEPIIDNRWQAPVPSIHVPFVIVSQNKPQFPPNAENQYVKDRSKEP